MLPEEEWQELSPLLDQALELGPAERASWLERLRRSRPALAASLHELLAGKAAIDAGHFLEHPAAHTFGEAAAAGQRLGAWQLERPLGQGGMGTVWLAHRCDGRYQGQAAVKLLNRALVGGPAEQRFVREGTLLAALKHPHIAQLIDAGVTGSGQPYLVLEHVDGRPIDEHCEAERLGVRARLRVFLAALEAVAYAHRHLVVHRDLKPSNILVTADGTVKLLDFGIATLLQPAVPELTRETGIALTPEFAAPEQLLGETVTTATDIYALGRILHVLLAGRPASGSAPRSAMEAARLTLGREPPLASEVCGDGALRRLLRGDLDNILRKAQKADPAERYATAQAFADDLRHYLADEPVSARPDSLQYRIGKFVRRHRGGVLAGAITAFALVGITVFAVIQMVEAERQHQIAESQRQRAQGYSTAMLGLLSQAAPDGRALAPSELLERAVEQVEATFGEDPAFLVQMLIMISGRYYDLQDTRREYDTLLRAEAAARKSGDPFLLFLVHCNTVETDLEAGRKGAARRRLGEALELLPAIAEVPAADHAACLRGAAQIASADGDMPGALARFREARQVLERADSTQGNVYAGILSMQVSYTREWGDLLTAHRYGLEVVELDRRFKRSDSRPGQMARVALANSLASLGEIRRAESMYREILADAFVGGPEKMFLGRVLARLGDYKEALPMLREAVAELDSSGHERFRIRARLALAEGLLFAGDPAGAEVPLGEAAAIIARDSVRHRFLALEADGLGALALLAAGAPDAAEDRIGQALERDAAMRYRGAERARLLLVQARVHLARVRPGDAKRTAAEAVALFERNSLDPGQNADLGEAALVLAEAELAGGHVPGAVRALDRALPALRAGLGPDHALTDRAEALAGELTSP